MYLNILSFMYLMVLFNYMFNMYLKNNSNNNVYFFC